MSLPVLSVISAGAGSGKTHTIQKRLAQWIVDGEVRPDRVLAVTFAEAAARELRERIHSELLSRGLPDAALRLEQSTITTIHGFGLRVASDYCFEAGISPAPRLLSDDEQDSLIRHALSETDRADAVMANLSAFAYRYDYLKGTAEEQFRQRVLDLIAVLRVIGRDDEDAALLRDARDRIRSRYGACEEPEPLEAALRKAARELLDDFPDDLSPTISNNKSAKKDFRQNHEDLTRASEGGALGRDWALWDRLRKLRTSGTRVHLPDAYQELAGRVMGAAEGILKHPGPLELALEHLDALFGAAQDSLARHGRAKRSAGLLDYTDMLSTASHLFHRDPTVLEDLVGRVDCVVIDEFQDTNPLQLSLLWALHRAGVPALIVGDRKQAIMRFQHADARLMEALERQSADAVEPLEENWRTREDLLAWMNEVGAGLFGSEYQELRPRATFPSSMEPLEVIDLHSKGRTDAAPYHAALRIHTLLNDPEQTCFDRRSQSIRRLRGEDIAVLCPTHALLEKYAEALRGLGLRVRMERGGWFASRIVQLACHALAYVAHPDSRHTRLYLAATELGSLTLESATKCLVDGEDIEDPLFQVLDQAGLLAPDRSPATVLDDVTAALDLFGRCARWPDGRQARANLLRLRAEAKVFADSHPESLASGGFFGSGLEVFLAWVEARAEREDGQPDAQVVDEDAIFLSTWHKAKGREWPVVAVCGTYRKVGPRLPNIAAWYPELGDLERILPDARIRYAPRFAVSEISERFSAPLKEDAVDDARRMLYVVLTRAREKVILEWPGYLAGREAETYWSILRREARLRLEDGVLVVGARKHAAVTTRGGKEKPKEYDLLASADVCPSPALARQSIRKVGLHEISAPEAITPSGLAGLEVKGAPEITAMSIAPALDLALEVQGVQRGALLHRCLEILGGDPARVGLLEEATRYVFTDEQKETIAITVEGFEAWIGDRFAPVAIEREAPVLGLDARGSVIAGTIDLLVETADGYWVLDYKSDHIVDPKAKFLHYLPQLQAYAEALSPGVGGKEPLGVGIFWLSSGEVTLALVADHAELAGGE